MTVTEKKPKRHNLVLPPELYRKLEVVAERQGTPVTELIKTCLKIGLVALEVENTPGSELVIRENGGIERKILIV
jgi:hypothetical protein